MRVLISFNERITISLVKDGINLRKKYIFAAKEFSSMKNPLLALLASLLLPTTGVAQMYRYNPNFTLSEKNFCDTIPIVIEDDQLYLDVEMGGKNRRFLLDTGSSQGMIYQNCDINGCTELGHIISHDANNHADTVKVVALPPFRLAKLTISHYVASVLPSPAVRPDYDAILGFDLFNRGLYAKIDTRNSIMILTDRKKTFQEEEKTGFTMKYKLKWFVPYLMVSPFVNHVDEVLFDTGFRQFYTMNKGSFNTHLENDLSRLNKHLGTNIKRQIEGRAKGQFSIGAFGAEKADEVVFLRLDRLKWNKFSFLDVRCITTQGASKIGSPLLNHGALIINPTKKRLTLLPYNGTDSVTIGNEQMSVAFVPANGRAAVGLIWDGSEAYQAGLRQGDIILKIDDKPIPTFLDFTAFRFIKDHRHHFLVRDKEGKEKDVWMKR